MDSQMGSGFIAGLRFIVTVVNPSSRLLHEAAMVFRSSQHSFFFSFFFWYAAAGPSRT